MNLRELVEYNKRPNNGHKITEFALWHVNFPEFKMVVNWRSIEFIDDCSQFNFSSITPHAIDFEDLVIGELFKNRIKDLGFNKISTWYEKAQFVKNNMKEYSEIFGVGGSFIPTSGWRITPLDKK